MIQRFVWIRLWQGLLTLFILVAVVFMMTRVTGDPLDVLLEIDASPELRARVAAEHGLDRPLPEQFTAYVGDLLRGEMGNSIRYRVPVRQLFISRFLNSLQLVVPAFLVALLMSVPLGVVAAVARSKPRWRWLDRLMTLLATIALAAPPFWIAILLVLLFAVWLGVLPVARIGGIRHHVLPVATLSLFFTAGIMRLIRSTMIESLSKEYIKLARLKGLSERIVVWRHALRNSLTAGVSFLGVYFASIITGSVVIEKVFAWPGAGQLLFDGVVTRDFPLVQGVIVATAALVVTVNLTFDIVQAYLDPRIRL